MSKRKKPTGTNGQMPERITLSMFGQLSEEARKKHCEEFRETAEKISKAMLAEAKEIADLFERYEAPKRKIRAELAGDGDDSFERFLLELRELTGLDFTQLAEQMPEDEVYAIAKAALRKQEAENWIPVAIDDLRHDKSTRSRYAKDPSSGLRSVGRGKFLVRRDRLSFFVREDRLKKYLSEG
jgi:hypothetical protein